MRSLRDMERRKKVLVGGGLALVVVLGIYFLFMGREQKAPPPQPSQGLRAIRKGMLKPIPFQVEESPVVRERRFAGRDPFRPPILTSVERKAVEERKIKALEEKRKAVEERRRKEEEIKEELKSLNISGIVWDLESPLAVINGSEVRVGDRIGSFRVKGIDRDRVILSFDGMDFHISPEGD